MPVEPPKCPRCRRIHWPGPCPPGQYKPRPARPQEEPEWEYGYLSPTGMVVTSREGRVTHRRLKGQRPPHAWQPIRGEDVSIPQEEPEWEYGLVYASAFGIELAGSHPVRPPTHRRRKAGPWEPIPQDIEARTESTGAGPTIHGEFLHVEPIPQEEPECEIHGPNASSFYATNHESFGIKCTCPDG